MRKINFGEKTQKLILLGLAGLFVSFGLTANAAAQGKKYGLFVGINTYQSKPLKGCVNDAKNLQGTLAARYGFDTNNTTLLTDEQATRDGILGSIKSYQAKAQAGDVFVLTFSGHGTLFPDAKSEEIDEEASLELANYYPLDKYDSAICPIDFRSTTSGKPWNNLILDDELYTLFSGFTEKGAMVVFLSDSCHSGTLARAVGDNNFKSKLQARARFLPLSQFRNLDSIPQPAKSRAVKRSKKDVNGLLIVLSGSRDNEFSLDYPDSSGETNGLFTKTLLSTISQYAGENKKVNYLTVRDVVAPEVSRLSTLQENSQTPQIDARFFNGDLTAPLFEFPNKTTVSAPTTENQLRVVVKVADKQGNAVDNASVGIFNPGSSLGAGRVLSQSARALGRTNSKGLYDLSKSEATNIQSMLLPRGTYLIKVIRDGYKPYIGEVKVEENAPGFCVLVVNLEKQ
ncbi:MAG: caspase family protein [Pyrinomonadaceae bacterium]|nr:caspase family protein [Pyrinomonadaceae bacterium]